jgi:3-isopropylmalate/(R)-2-methylmalate dehydratase large subunit
VTAKDIVLAIIGRIGTAGGHRPCHRVRRQRHPRPVHGRAHDGLQHGHRGRRPRRHGGGGRDHHRIRRRPALCPAGMTWDQAVAAWRDLHSDEAPRSTRWWSWTPPPSAAGHLGHLAGDGGAGGRARCRTRTRKPTRSRPRACARRWPTWGWRPARDHRHPPGPCVHRLLHQLAHRGPARGGGGGEGAQGGASIKQALVVPGSGLVKQQAEQEGWTGSSSRPVSNGAPRAAPCAWP